jgi:hypothetical protein
VSEASVAIKLALDLIFFFNYWKDFDLTFCSRNRSSLSESRAVEASSTNQPHLVCQNQL